MKIRGKPPRASGRCATLAHVSTPTVLLVEDEPEIVGLLTDFLAVEGFGVVAADDARGAIAALRRHDVDCVLLDVMLPGASGFDVCRRIRERSDVPLLFLSARGEDDDKLRGLALGADDYIVKSATPAEVVARVKAVLRRSANGRSTSRRRYGRLEIDLAAHEILVGRAPRRAHGARVRAADAVRRPIRARCSAASRSSSACGARGATAAPCRSTCASCATSSRPIPATRSCS